MGDKVQPELKVYPLTESESIVKVNVKDQLNGETKSVQTVIILDKSGSMGDSARRLTNKVLPLFLSKLNYDSSDRIHFITFDSDATCYNTSVFGLKTLSVVAGGGTNKAPAIKLCQEQFEDFDHLIPVRVLSISDGEINDRPESEAAAKQLVESLANRSFAINSQAVRFFTSASQPDTTALASLLQINNVTNPTLARISAFENDEVIATKIAELFQDDKLSQFSVLTSNAKNIHKNPWEANPSSDIILTPGENLFWVDEGAQPLKMEIGGEPVKIDQQPELNLHTFQALMDEKLEYLVNLMAVLKVVGTDEAETVVQLIAEYFETTEEELVQTIKVTETFCETTTYTKKISRILEVVVNDTSIRGMNAEMKASFLEKIKKWIAEERTKYMEEVNSEIFSTTKKCETETTISEKMVIIPKSYPTDIMTESMVKAVHEYLVKSIDGIKEGEFAPNFNSHQLVDGYLLMTCIGLQSSNWLVNIIKQIKFSVPLEVIGLEDLKRSPICKVHFPLPIVPGEKILQRLRVQNQEINMSSWNITDKEDNADGQVAYIFMNQESINKLQARNFNLSYLLSQVRFELLKKS